MLMKSRSCSMQSGLRRYAGSGSRKIEGQSPDRTKEETYTALYGRSATWNLNDSCGAWLAHGHVSEECNQKRTCETHQLLGQDHLSPREDQ